MAAILLTFLAVLILDQIEAIGEKSEKYCDAAYSKTFSLNNPSTKVEEFPYIVPIGYIHVDVNDQEITFKCSGILISEKYVMTSAHCLHPRDYTAKPVQIKLGIIKLNSTYTDEDIIQTINISELIVHPEYIQRYAYNDIGLIKLEQPVKLSKNVRPICLENKKKSHYPSLLTATLGILGYAKDPRRELKEFKFIEYDSAECKKHYPESYKLTKGIDEASMICAGNQKSDPCVESGNPLIVVDPDYGYRIVGVAIFSKSCNISDVPAVFSRISNYIGWIESVVWS